MIKQILSAAALSFALVSAAWALPAAPKADLPALNQSDIIQVGHGHGGKAKASTTAATRTTTSTTTSTTTTSTTTISTGRYYHGGRYWGRRYYSRPYNWQALGCVVVGPVWYCP